MQDPTITSTRAWWRFGYVWLVIAGPAGVVLASLVTAYIAVTRPDPLVSEDYYRQGMEINKTMQAQAQAASLAPAVQARNHAATGTAPGAKPQ